MSRGRGIHHDEVVGPGFHPPGNLQQGREFIQTGQGQVQNLLNILLVQEGPPGRDLGKFASVPGLKGFQRFLGIELQDL